MCPNLVLFAAVVNLLVPFWEMLSASITVPVTSNAVILPAGFWLIASVLFRTLSKLTFAVTLKKSVLPSMLVIAVAFVVLREFAVFATDVVDVMFVVFVLMLPAFVNTDDVLPEICNSFAAICVNCAFVANVRNADVRTLAARIGVAPVSMVNPVIPFLTRCNVVGLFPHGVHLYCVSKYGTTQRGNGRGWVAASTWVACCRQRGRWPQWTAAGTALRPSDQIHVVEIRY